MKTPSSSLWRGFSPAGSFLTIVSLSLIAGQRTDADLLHRWSFDNPAGSADGATLTDTVGGAGFEGFVMGTGATFTGTSLRLPGGPSATAPYADLPNDLIGANSPIVAGSKQLSIEGWVTLKGVGPAWARYFDFGSGTAGEIFGPGGGFEGTNYLFYSAATGANYATQQLEIRVAAGDGANTVWRPDKPAAVDQEIYFAVTVDSSDDLSSIVNLYRNNEHLLTDGFSGFALNQINDVNNWLGRSNWSNDGNLNGEFNEFRIYDHVLSDAEVFASRASGPTNLVVDTDNDGMPDGWEILNGLNVGVDDSGGNPDGDGLTNVQEFQRGTDPNNPDSDADGLSDEKETNTGFYQSPANTGTDPLNPDSDRDGLLDGVETKTGTYVGPTNTGTDPLARDSDLDGAGDGTEVASGSNPNTGELPVPKIDHRYSFSETAGTRVADSISGANGRINASGYSRTGGSLVLDGGSSNTAAYVSLPAGILSNYGLAKGGRGAVTIEGWATVASVDGGNWARLVDFGSSDPAGDNGAIFGPGNWNGGGTGAFDTLFASAYNGTDTTVRQITLRKTDGAVAPEALMTPLTSALPGDPVHFAITFDESSGVLRYFEGGLPVTITETNAGNPIKLSSLKDVNNWLGRSNYTNDGNLHGSYNEIRIYDGVLPDSVIAQHFTAGPDAAPVPAAGGADTDGDGMPDWFERANGLNPASNADAIGDPDGDTVTNLQEFQRGSSPNKADTDGDGLSDAVETNTGTFVSAANTGTSPAAYDSDGDFASDNAEVLGGSDPTDLVSIPANLLHRWSFNNPAGDAPSGSSSVDAVTGLASAQILGEGALFTGNGVSLPGGGSGFAAYVDLPNNLVSPLKAVTVETWVSLQSNFNAWARIFDFGNTVASPGVGKEITGPGDSGEGGDYWFVSATTGTDYNINRIEFREATPGPVVNAVYDSGVIFAQDELIHYVAMVESTVTGTSRMTLWRNGVPLVVNGPAPVNLSNLDDVNNWLGRSNWTGDANLNGTFDEFRIYDGLLSPQQIARNLVDGPDAAIGVVTDPNFQILSVSAPTGLPVSITFPTETGETYQVESSTQLTGGSWSAVGAPVAGSGSPVTVQDTVNGIPSATGGRRFYQVRRQ